MTEGIRCSVQTNSRLSRRTLLAGAFSLALTPSVADLTPGPLVKTIPSTGRRIPAIGMGSWLTFDVGGDNALRRVRTDVVRTFLAMGGAVIDSSPMYGTSQDVIGHALEQLGQPGVFSADKVWIEGAEAGRAQIAESRRRWGVPQFDLLQVHNLISWREHLESLFAMKAENTLAYAGVTSYAGLRYDEIERIMRDHPIDFIQITYNLADRRAENRLLPLALEKGIAVIANRPFGEGALIDAVMKRKLPGMAAEIDAENWAQYLLKFIVSHPAITAAIPATRRVDHMVENMGALSGPLPDAGLRERMAKAFDAF